jgi:hypothetical protein
MINLYLILNCMNAQTYAYYSLSFPWQLPVNSRK